MEQPKRTAVTVRNDEHFELMFQQPGALVVIVISFTDMESLQKQIKDAAEKQLVPENENSVSMGL